MQRDATKLAVISFLAALLFPGFLLAQEADLHVQKEGPSEAPAASDVAYTLTVGNAGPDDAEFVSLSDPVPTGMSFVSVTQNTGPTFSCDATVDCTIATLPAGAEATFTFVFHIDSGTSFLNTATVSSETFDPNEENDTSSIGTAVTVPMGDLSVQKSGPAGAAPDTDVTFTITLFNAGPDAAENVLLTDNLPAPLTFVSFTQTSGPSMSCGTSTCTLASFPANATATFELVGHVPAGTSSGTEITNVASVESENDPAEENNSGSVTLIVASADVSVVKTGPPTAVAGTTITYDLTVTNNGPDAALNVVVTDPQVCDVVNCNLGLLGPGASINFSADVDIPASALSWSNTATVTTDSIDSNSANNTSTVATAITTSADVSIVKNGPATIGATDDITYTVSVTNDGPSDAQGVTVSDPAPSGTTFVSSTCGTSNCNIGTLAAGASANLTFTFNVGVNATSPVTNTATVTATTADPDSSNNEATASATVTTANVSIAKSGPATIVATNDISYTVTVTNNGPAEAQGVTVTDPAPAGTTFVSSTCGSTTCNIGALVNGASANLTFTFHVNVDAASPLTNTATVTTTTTDPDPADNTTTFTTVVDAPPADVSVTKAADYAQSVTGAIATYTLVATNSGPGAAPDVVVTDVLPDGTTLVSASPGCTGTTTVVCSAGTLTAGASATFTLAVTLPSTPGDVVNTAIVSTSATDPESANDSASVTITAAAQAAAIPALSPFAMLLLAAALGAIVLVTLRAG